MSGFEAAVVILLSFLVPSAWYYIKLTIDQRKRLNELMKRMNDLESSLKNK